MSWNSGSMMGDGQVPPRHRREPELVSERLNLGGANLVTEAKAALRAFRIEDRRTAKMLLRLWSRRIELTRDQVEQILREYPEVEIDLEPGW